MARRPASWMTYRCHAVATAANEQQSFVETRVLGVPLWSKRKARVRPTEWCETWRKPHAAVSLRGIDKHGGENILYLIKIEGEPLGFGFLGQINVDPDWVLMPFGRKHQVRCPNGKSEVVAFMENRDLAGLYSLLASVMCLFNLFSIPLFSTCSLLSHPCLSHARSCPMVIVRIISACWSSSHGALAWPISPLVRSLVLTNRVGLGEYQLTFKGRHTRELRRRTFPVLPCSECFSPW